MLNIELSQIKIIESKVKEDGYVSLSQGALRIGGIPTQIKQHLQSVLHTDKTDYYQSSWGILPLREKIAQQLSVANETELTEKNILVTHGCMGAVSVALLALLEPGDEVLLPEPTYPAYKNVVSLARAHSVYVFSSGSFTENDMDALEAVRTNRTRMLIFSNPCNPTGALVSTEALARLVAWCEQNKIYLIVDESYDDFIFEGTFVSATKLVKKSRYVIRTGSYSKSLSMSGWRVGFMVVHDELSVLMGITQDALLNCPNVIAQYAVLHALDHPEYTSEFCNIVRSSRDCAIEMLQPLVARGLLSFARPEAGFYLFLKTEEVDTYDLCFDLLRREKVGLIPGRAFGPSGAPYIRLCYARDMNVLVDGVERVNKYFLRN